MAFKKVERSGFNMKRARLANANDMLASEYLKFRIILIDRDNYFSDVAGKLFGSFAIVR